MKILKSRTVLGVICIVVSLLICFGVTPLFNKEVSKKVEIVRVVKDIKIGDKITGDMVRTVEVGSLNLPSEVMKNKENVIGKYASADMAPGDYIINSKVADEPAAENAYLYNLSGEKQAISVSVKSFATGLSGKLKSGDIVSVIAPDYQKQGETVIPPELKYVEVIAVTAGSGYRRRRPGGKGTAQYGDTLGNTGTEQDTRHDGEGREPAHISCIQGNKRKCSKVYYRAGTCFAGTLPAGNGGGGDGKGACGVNLMGNKP